MMLITLILHLVILATKPGAQGNSLKPLTVKEGDKADLNCKESYAEGETVWFKMRGHESPYQLDTGKQPRLFIDTSGTLHFAFVIKDDAGRYKCGPKRGDNIQLGSETLISIANQNGGDVMSKKPTPTWKTPDADVLPKTDVKLQCVFSGRPLPTVTWRHNGKSVLSDGDTLWKKNVTFKDKGNYTCVGSNVAGSAEQTIQLYVNDTNTLDIPVGKEETGKGQEKPEDPTKLNDPDKQKSIEDESVSTDKTASVKANPSKTRLTVILVITALGLIAIATTITGIAAWRRRKAREERLNRITLEQKADLVVEPEKRHD